MTDEREIITGRIRRTNMLEGDLDAKEQIDHELIKEHLNEAPG